MRDQEQLNQAAAHAAECHRVVSEMRRKYEYVKRLTDATMLLDEDAAVVNNAARENNSSPGEIEPALAQAEQAFRDAFEVISIVVHKRAFDEAKRRQRSDFDADDFAQEAVIHVMAKIGQFDGRAFLGWLRTVLFRYLVSWLRHPVVDVIDYDWNLEEGDFGDVFPARPIDHHAITSAVAEFVATESPKPEYQYLFIVASQLWPYVDTKLQANWAEQYRSPSDWEQQELSSLWRCNQIALDWSDQMAPSELAAEFDDSATSQNANESFATVSLEDQEAVYQDCFTKACQSIAQNLTRHYACLMEAPAIHDYLFRDVPLAEVQLEEDEIPDRREVAFLLQFDAWIGLPGKLWERWRCHHQLNNAIQQNYGRLLAMPGAVTKKNTAERSGERREQVLNGKKFSAVVGWLGDVDVRSHADADAQTENLPLEETNITDALSELRVPIVRLIRHATRCQQRLDLPIPFQKMDIDETVRIRETTE